jgi:hypothetical protein
MLLEIIMLKLETVTIDTENGPVVINKSDYDAKVHVLVGEKKKPVKKKVAAKKSVKNS